MVQVEYDKKADALYIWVRKAKYDISEELAENVIIDLDKAGRIIGIEVLDASKKHGAKPDHKNFNHRKTGSNSIKPRRLSTATSPPLI